MRSRQGDRWINDIAARAPERQQIDFTAYSMEQLLAYDEQNPNTKRGSKLVNFRN